MGGGGPIARVDPSPRGTFRHTLVRARTIRLDPSMSGGVIDSDDDDAADGGLPGYRNYLVYGDESGIDGQVYYGFGTLWLPYEARGRLTQLVRRLRRESGGLQDELGWSAVNAKKLPLCLALVEEFFRARWLMFHCIVVPREIVNPKLHAKGYETAREKHFCELMVSALRTFGRGSADKTYHLRIDPFPSSYRKTDEKLHRIINASVKKELGVEPITTMTTVDSKRSAGVQLADLLLGAVMSAWQTGKVATNPAKRAMRSFIAAHLGWPDLRSDTFPVRTDPLSWKFNVWLFCGHPDERREKTQRKLRFRFDVPPYRG